MLASETEEPGSSKDLVVTVLRGRMQAQKRHRGRKMKLHLIDPVLRFLDIEHRAAFRQQPLPILFRKEIAHSRQIGDHLRPRHGPIFRRPEAGAHDGSHEVELVLLHRGGEVMEEPV